MASDAIVEGVSGAAGGIVALLSTYPLMTISTMQATRAKPPVPIGGSQNLNLEGTPKHRYGALADIAEAVRLVGVRGLFSGLQPALLGTAVSQGVYFYFYSLLRDLAVSRKHAAAGTTSVQRSREQELPIGASLLVAAFAGAGNVLLTNPIWVVATRMQSNRDAADAHLAEDAPSGPLAVASDIYKRDGPLGFWKGVLPALVMVCNPTVQYVLFEWLLARLRTARMRSQLKGGPSATQIFAIGATAKLGATVVTYPLLLVKSRLMSTTSATEAAMRYRGTWDALCRIYNEDGFLGFYRGLRAKVVQSVLAAAILFAVREKLYNLTQKALRKAATVKVA